MTAWRQRWASALPRTAVVVHDLAMVWLAWNGLRLVRYGLSGTPANLPPLWSTETFVVLAAQALVLWRVGLYRGLWRFASVPDLVNLAKAGLFGVIAIGLGLFVYNLALLGQSGQTIGKQWLGIRIVRSDGSNADLGRVFGLRMFLPGLITAFAGPLFSLPDALCIFGNEKRCIHDMMADTIVVVA